MNEADENQPDAEADGESGADTSKLPLAQQPVRHGGSVPIDSWWGGLDHVDEEPEHRE